MMETVQSVDTSLRRLLLSSTLVLTSVSLFAQTVSVKGTVTDPAGEPIIGATVLEKGTTNGTMTDAKGHFVLKAKNPKATIRVSYVGYKPLEIALDGRREIKVVLTEEAATLNEVVVVGYGTVGKKELTSAVTHVSSKNFSQMATVDPSMMIQGKVAGVSITNTGAGDPNNQASIQVRGVSSRAAGLGPLIVIDGVPGGNLTNLNPNDIESFDILKDGAASAIYGTRGSNGVILVTTKKGKQGQANFNYTGEFTSRLIPSYRDFDILNSQQQMSIYRELRDKGWLNFAEVLNGSDYGIYGKMYELINTYNPKTRTFMLDNTTKAENAYLQQAERRNTNWFKELFSPSIMQTHSVSMSGGTSKSNYYASASALIDPGWYKQSQVKRYTANLNVTHHLLKSLSLNVIGGASYRNQRAPGTLGQDVDVVGGEVKRDFDINPYSYATNTSRVLDPREYYTANYAPFNIFNELENNYIDLDVLDAKFQAELRFKPIRGLELTLLGAFKHTAASQQHNVRDNSNQALAYRAMPNSVIRESNKYLYRDPDHPYDLPSTVLPNGGFMHKGENRMSNYDFRATANYNRTFGVHTLNLFGGLETTNIQRNRTAFTGWGLQYAAGETPFYPYQYFKKQVEDGNSYYNLNNTNYRTVAFYSNATYSYKGRYVVNGTYRYEGSNQLGRSSNARWMSTWNVSGAWNMHEEDFFQKLKPLSHLTLRLSYSLTGTPPDPSYSSSTTILKSYIPFRLFAEDQEPGIGIEQLGNADLTYEKKNELNAGFDAGLFGDRLSLSFDAYTRRNFDEMGPMITQGIGGTIIRPANVAEMMSSGLELSITSQNIKTKDFNWTTSFIYSYTHSEITKLYNQGRMIDLVSGNGFAKKGYPARALFSIPFVGLNNQGLPQLINEKGEVTTDNINFQERNHTEYLKYEGPTDPTHTGSLGNTLSYKGLHLNVFLTYAFGNVVRLDPKFKAYYGDMASMTHAFINRWQAAGEEARTDIPTILSRRQYATNNNLRYAYNGYNYSTARIAKGDFIRLKEISLAYDLPTSLIKRTPLRSASVKVQATNLFLLYADKKLNGQDPEFFNIGGVASPTPRQFTLTLKLGL